MYRSIVLLLLPLILGLVPLHQTTGEEALQVEIRAVGVTGDQVAVDFRVRDGSGHDVLDLTYQDVQIIENAGDPKAITDAEQFSRQQTDDRNPTRTLSLSDGQPYKLVGTSATIGIVFDAVDRGDDGNQIDEWRDSWQALKMFLCTTPGCTSDTPRTKVPSMLEGVSLFIPDAVEAPMPTWPSKFRGFPQDAVLRAELLIDAGTIRRDPPTQLWKTLAQAVEETAKKAEERGGRAVVLVVSSSDDKDSYDDPTVADIIKTAQAHQAIIVTLRAGAGTKLDEPLLRLAKETGGYFAEIPSGPWSKPEFVTTISTFFDDVAAVTHTALYTVHYPTKLVPSATGNTVQVRINRGSPPALSSAWDLPLGENVSITPLGEALVQNYLLVAVPIALLVSLLTALLTLALRWSQSRSTGISR
jgi:hypothetical protein